MKRKTISEESLKLILDDHKTWLSDKADGKRADLSNYNLQHFNLRKVNLKDAIMRNVDLSFSILEDAKLGNVDLEGSDIVRANLNGINLSHANLSHTDLRESNISKGKEDDEGFSLLANLNGANFFKANLGKVEFIKASLIKVNFTEAILKGTRFNEVVLVKAIFINSVLENTSFNKTNLSEADISGASLTNSSFNNSNITGIKYNESWHQKEYVKYRGLRVESSYGSPVFKRFSQDQDYLFEYMNKHHILFNLWYYTSKCGRSISRWVFLSFLIALFFGAIHANNFALSWLPQFNFNLEISEGKATLFTPYYFSFVTFTTLGFGDITPKGDLAGEIWVTLEVILGYVMLGGLISILSNKIAQRS